MSKIIIKLIMVLLCSVILTGCSEKILVNGEYYDTLTQKEYDAMIRFARGALKSNPDKKVTSGAKNFISKTEPKVIISYTGDKKGYASYEWVYANKYIYKFICTGEFMTEFQVIEVKIFSVEMSETKAEGDVESAKLSLTPFAEIE